MNPTEVLLNAASPDGNIRNEAERFLRDASADIEVFLKTLVGIITSEAEPQAARQMAAIVLKNTVAVRSKDAAKKAALEAKWRNLSPQARTDIKDSVLSALGSPERNVRFTVSLLVANLARIEVPFGQWDTLMPLLCQVCTGPNANNAEAAMLTIGYICEETEESEDLETALSNSSRPILDAIFSCMQRPEQPLVYSACRTLVYALDFIHEHMGVDVERTYIVGQLCTLCGCPDERTRERAMEGVMRIAELYYHVLPAHLDDFIRVTVDAIQNHQNNEGASVFAMQFWAHVCETEAELGAQNEENLHIVHKVRADLFQVMWTALQCQEEGQTNEDWNLSVAASKVLAEMSRALGNDMLGVAMQTALDNVQSAQWRQQDAAIVLFGCIMPGPDPEKIESLVSSAIPALAETAGGGHRFVRDSAAWVLSQVAAFFPSLLLNPNAFMRIFELAKVLLRASAELAERGLSILHNLATFVDEYYSDWSDEDEGRPRPHTNELSPNYQALVQLLGSVLDDSNTPDNVRVIAQETLNVTIHAAGDDCVPILHGMVPLLVAKLNHFSGRRRAEGSGTYLNTQIGLLCGAITAIARKVDVEMERHKDIVLPALHNALVVPPTRQQSIVMAQSTVDEGEARSLAGVESVICVSAMILALRDQMWPVLNQFSRFILDGLSQVEDEDVYTASLGVLGDICNVYGPRSLDVITMEGLKLLREQLYSDDTPITLKPDIMKCLGDVALFFGPQFSSFAPDFLRIAQDLATAAKALELDDEDTKENAISVFIGIASFCSQVLQGLKENLPTILEFVPWMVTLCEEVGMKFTTSDPDLLEALVALVGDLASCLKDAHPEVLGNAQRALNSQAITQLLRGAADFTQVESVTETAQWAQKQVAKLMNRRGNGNR